MPPRKRPVNNSALQRSQYHPANYLQPFQNYLRAECGMSANTLQAYATDLKQFTDWLDHQKVMTAEQVDLDVLGRYLQELHKRDLAATTIARRMVSMKMFFRFLVLEGVLTESKADLLSSPKLWNYLPTVLSPEMVDRLLMAPSGDDRHPLRDRALLVVLYATGCRASEVCGLKLRDMHLDERYCRCLGKGNKERIVHLNPVAVAALQAYLHHERPGLCRGDEEYVFLTRRGQVLDRITVWKIVKKYAGRIGVASKVSPHTLRHSFATHMLAGGAEIRALQEMLGHASIRTTQVYTQVEHSRLKSIHKRCHPRG